jgi:DNA-binding transcriptional LysR family regulator
MVDLNNILLFAQIVDAGSFAAAARRLRKPANSVSRRIQELEETLGVQLFHRSTRKLVLTTAGARLYDETGTQLANALQCARSLSEDQAVPGGTVRFAATADFLEGFRGEWIDEFFEAYPKVKLELLLDDHRIDLLEHGIDIAFRGGTSADPQIVFEHVGSTRRILIASPKYLAARGEPLSIADLATHDCLPLLGRNPERVWHLQGPDGDQTIEVSGRFSVSTIRGSLLAAISSFGIAFLPAPLARSPIARGELREVLPGIASQAFEIYSVHRANTRLTKAAITFRAFVAEKLLSNGLIDPPRTTKKTAGSARSNKRPFGERLESR